MIRAFLLRFHRFIKIEMIDRWWWMGRKFITKMSFHMFDIIIYFFIKLLNNNNLKLPQWPNKPNKPSSKLVPTPINPSNPTIGLSITLKTNLPLIGHLETDLPATDLLATIVPLTDHNRTVHTTTVASHMIIVVSPQTTKLSISRRNRPINLKEAEEVSTIEDHHSETEMIETALHQDHNVLKGPANSTNNKATT